MSLTIRMFLILTLLAPIAGAFAQEETSTAAAATSTKTTTSTDETTTADTTTTGEKTTTAEGDETADPKAISNYEVRNRFTTLLRNHPWELAMILKLDPSLINNETFVNGYPDLADFLREYPEVRRNPRFYLVEFPMPGKDESVLDDIFETLAAMIGIAFAVFSLGWFIRTLIEQKRWSKLSKQQAEVHNKILDRFGTSNEVLDYIRTPAGTKFLESAPIPLHTEKPVRRTSGGRIFWSIQLGVIVAIGALGMLLVSLRFKGETGEGLFALGAIGFCVGAGFIASAVVSILLSRRLGTWASPEPTPIDDAELMR